MPLDPDRDPFLRMIEARREIGGRFTNIRRVGAAGGDGHFSLVFQATDNLTNQEVAIKVFRPDRLTDTYRFQCFCREASLLEQLRGTPNVLAWVSAQEEFIEVMQSTYGIPIPLRFPYFAVELASSDVGTAIRDGHWTPEQKLFAFREMCKGVQRIHRRGVTHRDIKPNNFLIMGNGEVKLSDFGTARDIGSSEPPLVASYQIAPGDSRYTAPEMHALLHDNDASIALRGDIYSLGATLFEMCSGTVLGIQLFSPSFARDLAQAMGAVHKRDRQRIYLEFVQGIDAGHPLPAISAYGTDVPPCARELVEGLYRPMAALDYRRRLCDFERIFLKIDQCLVVLKNEEKVSRWRKQREIFRRNYEEKLVRRREHARSATKTGDRS